MYHKTTQKCRTLIGQAEIAVAIAELQGALKEDMQAVALAAPQIGNNVQAFIVRKQRNIGGLFINPAIIWHSDETTEELEGCRSLPDIGFIPVTRYKSVKLRYEDERGNEHTRTFHGFAARIVQHEIAHLRGVMIC